MPEKIHPKKTISEYSKITEYIFIGTNQCCNPTLSQELLKKEIEADVSLEVERIDTP